jgi:hypothetical protein
MPIRVGIWPSISTAARSRIAARSCGGVANQIGALLTALVSAC